MLAFIYTKQIHDASIFFVQCNIFCIFMTYFNQLSDFFYKKRLSYGLEWVSPTDRRCVLALIVGMGSIQGRDWGSFDSSNISLLT